MTNRHSVISKKKSILLALFAVLYMITNTCLSEPEQVIGKVAIFKEPPNAYELAKLLYPPKTRKIILDQEPNAVPVAPAEVQPTTVAFMVNFEYDSVSIKEDSQPYLDALGDMLNFAQLKDKSLSIEGHADASGDAVYNLRLSESRAQSIKEYLQRVHSIDPSRLFVTGYGESNLFDQAHPYAEVNRRAEFSPMPDDG